MGRDCYIFSIKKPTVLTLPTKPPLPVRIKLILSVLSPVSLTLEGADALKTLRALLLVCPSLTQHLHQTRLLGLLLKSRLQTVIAFVAFLDCVNRHRAGIG